MAPGGRLDEAQRRALAAEGVLFVVGRRREVCRLAGFGVGCDGLRRGCVGGRVGGGGYCVRDTVRLRGRFSVRPGRFVGGRVQIFGCTFEKRAGFFREGFLHQCGLRIGVFGHEDRLAQRQAAGMRVRRRVGDAHDAEAAETVEFAVAGIGGKRGEVDRHDKVRAFGRPEDGLARPGVAPAEQIADLAVRIEIEAGCDSAELLAGNGSGGGADGGGEFFRDFAEAALGVDLPDEADRPALAVETEARIFFGRLVRLCLSLMQSRFLRSRFGQGRFGRGRHRVGGEGLCRLDGRFRHVGNGFAPRFGRGLRIDDLPGRLGRGLILCDILAGGLFLINGRPGDPGDRLVRRPGDRFVPLDDTDTVIALKPDGRSFVVVHTNPGLYARRLTLGLPDGAPASDYTVSAVVTDEGRKAETMYTHRPLDGEGVVAPPMSITTFVVTSAHQ